MLSFRTNYEREYCSSLDVRSRRELQNIIDRLLINYYNRFDLPISIAKSIDECCEKSIDPNILKPFHNYLHNASPGDEDIGIYSQEYSALVSYLQSHYPQVDRKNVESCAARYLAIGCLRGQHWSPDRLSIIDEYNKCQIKIEGFASPLNTNVLRRISPKLTGYCSIFTEDMPFGSLGSFYDLTTIDHCDVCPPYVPEILDKIPSYVKNTTHALIITPSWTDAQWYKELSKSGFKEKIIRNMPHYGLKYDTRSHKIEEYRFTAPFPTTIWTKYPECGI